jgi:maltokinase
VLLRTLARVTADYRAAIEAAGPDLWTAPHLGGSAPDDASFHDVVPLGHGALAVWALGEELLVAPVVADETRVRRAVAGDGVFAALAEELGAFGGGGGGDRDRDERSVGVDQTNESVIVDDAVVVKLLRRTRRGPQPGQDLPAHLAAVGFTETPASAGAFTWRDALLATSAAYLPGAEDGWRWYVGFVEEAALGTRSWADAELATTQIGALVARFQRALATPSPVVPSPVATAPAGTIAGWHAAASATLDEALVLTDGAVHERLRMRAPGARVVLDRFALVAETPMTRIHGDLHVGQILRVPDGSMFVSDLDGDPVAPVDGRVAPGSPARDVASMACALDHVGRVVVRRHPDARDVIEEWIPRARAAFHAAHRAALGPDRSLVDERLVHPFAVAQEAHEFVYAVRFQPPWIGVPDAALPAVLAWGDDA